MEQQPGQQAKPPLLGLLTLAMRTVLRHLLPLPLVTLEGLKGRLPSSLILEIKEEAKLAEAMLDHTLCRFPNVEGEDGMDEEEEEDEVETIFMESRAKAKEIASEEFPFIFYVVGNEEAFDRPVFPTYRGPVYWSDYSKWEWSSSPGVPLKDPMGVTLEPPLLIHEGGPTEALLTPRTLCQAVAKRGRGPRDPKFLEKIVVLQIGPIQGGGVEDAMFLVFLRSD